MKISSLSIAAVLFASLSSAAQAGIWFPPRDAGIRNLPRDTTSFVLRVFDCNSGRSLGQGSAFANHGTVTYKDGTSRGCGKANAATTFVYYTPNPGFVGQDDVTVYLGPAPYHMVINVGSGPAPAAARPTIRRRAEGPSSGSGGRATH